MWIEKLAPRLRPPDSLTQSVIDKRREAGLPKVFINYRNRDIWAAVGINDIFKRKLGQEAVFFASQSIPGGTTYPHIIKAGIDTAKALIVIIGHDWAEDLKSGKNEWTLAEIEAAQAKGTYTLPVLLQDVTLPSRKSLPPSIDPQLITGKVYNFGLRDPETDLQAIFSHIARKVLP